MLKGAELMENKSFMDRITDFSNRISKPLVVLSNNNEVAAIVGGLQSVMPVIMIGSLFLILFVLGSPSVGDSGRALLPFLEPWAEKFVWMNSATLGFMALYTSIAIPMNYAERLSINMKNAALIGLGTFLLFTIGGFDEAGGLPVLSFSASGLFASMITSLVSVRLYKWIVDRNLIIKMPDSVPPNISSAFTAIVPFGISFALAWFIRSILNFDFITVLNTFLEPLVTGADSIWFAIFAPFITLLLWSVGLHGDNMFMSLFTPVGLMWIETNSAALSGGVAANELPHILAGTGSGLLRLTVWTASVWPLIFLMLISKNKFLKTLGITSFGPGVFAIVEPVIYGLPVALNPYLLVPFVLSGSISSAVGYLLMSTSFFNKFYALMPWATPPPLLGPLGTGDWKTAMIPFISFFIGLIIYLPFWRIYVRKLEKEELVSQQAPEKL
jgi:PTS system cellobiose-specific IIC component